MQPIRTYGRKRMARDVPLTFKLAVLSFLILFSTAKSLKAQTFELIGANSVNGAVTGSILGAAVMGLTDSNNLDAVKIGTGAGIISGLAIAVHDIAVLPRGQRFYISGTFNDGTNSSILILLDTFYGVVTGAVTGTAAMLISNRPLLDGLQYGAATGAWAGFAFGLADAFILGQRNEDFITSALGNSDSLMSFHHAGIDMNLMKAGIVTMKKITGNDLYTTRSPALQIVRIQIPVR